MDFQFEQIDFVGQTQERSHRTEQAALRSFFCQYGQRNRQAHPEADKNESLDHPYERVHFHEFGRAFKRTKPVAVGGSQGGKGEENNEKKHGIRKIPNERMESLDFPAPFLLEG